MWETKSKGWIITGFADISRELNAFDTFGEADELKKSQSFALEMEALLCKILEENTLQEWRTSRMF